MSIKTKLKPQLWCRGCGADWEYNGSTVYTRCPRCDRKIDARNRAGEKTARIADSDSLRAWQADKERVRISHKKRNSVMRKRAFFRVSGSVAPACIRCGCDDVRLLEINHKDPSTVGGRKRARSGQNLLRAIVKGICGTGDLELLCRPCNAIHYLEYKLGEQLPIKVLWEGTKDEGSRK